MEQLLESARDQRVLQPMERFYDDLNEEIAQQPGHCWLKTACCHLDQQSGHRLFVTFLEVCDYLARHVPPEATGTTCAHLSNGICQIRNDRPLGCRIYYCDPAAQHWQESMAETYLLRLKHLHNELNVPYFYADWLHVLDVIRAHGRDGLSMKREAAHESP